MFHAINAWLARLARRVHDARTAARGNDIAVMHGWRVERAGATGFRYRDPRFDLLKVGYDDDGQAVAVDMRTGKVVRAGAPGRRS